MKRLIASVIALAIVGGCAGVKPSGEVTGGLPGVASATLTLDRDASPAEVSAAIETGLQACVDRQDALANGNRCLCILGHPQRALLASMKGFTECFPSPDPPPVELPSCPAVPDPVPCPVSPPCPVCAALPPSPSQGTETGYALPDWCADNGDSPYCVEIAKRYAAERGLDLYRERLQALTGCEHIGGKDGYHVTGKATYACDRAASELIDGLSDG